MLTLPARSSAAHTSFGTQARHHLSGSARSQQPVGGAACSEPLGGAAVHVEAPSGGACSEPLGGVVVHVEVVEAHVAVLAACAEAAAVWVERNRVDRPEVAAHVAKLLGVDLVEEARLKAARLCRRRRHARCVLAAAEQDMVVQRGDGGRLHQAAGVVRLERLKRLRVDQLRPKGEEGEDARVKAGGLPTTFGGPCCTS
eukprot:363348-Chlamydomonas_euryale.AAC.17